MATLAEMIERVIVAGNYEDDWGIWASHPHTLQSEARWGQTQFKNGGVLDEMEFFATNRDIIDAAWEYCDGDPNAKDCPFDIDEIVWAVFDAIDEQNFDYMRG